MINSNVSDDRIDCANFHCAAQLLLVLLESDPETWDHGLSEIASDMNKMDAITSEWIKENWQNVEFVKFVF